MKRLIVGADDFGIAREVNEAVERAPLEGVLRAASLMIGAHAADDAVERARRLPPERIPDLVDRDGNFFTDLVRTGFRFFFRPGVRAQYGLRAVRHPREPFGGTRTIAPWLWLMRRRAGRSGILCNDYAIGVNGAGALTEERVLRHLDALPDGITEMFFHPAVRAFAGADAGTESYEWSGELAALTSPRMREAIVRDGIVSTTYGELYSTAST